MSRLRKACCKASGLKLPVGVLEGRILHDAFEQGRVADAELQALGMGVDRGAADQPLQHAVLEPGLARFLQARGCGRRRSS